jgi:CubicO group peptidase (beta-lactamase class C family)
MNNFSAIQILGYFAMLTSISVHANEPTIPDVDAYLNTAVVENNFSGVVLIAQGDDLLHHRAYSGDESLTLNSRFWIGSLTKPFTSIAIMKLQEEGKLAVGSLVSTYIQEMPEDKAHITFHHLLTHTSGLANHYASDDIVDRDEAIRTIMALPIEQSPGTLEYSNDGYNLLAVLVSTVSGESYEEYLGRVMLKRAGMRNTGFWWVSPELEPSAFAPIKKLPSDDRARQTWGYKGATGIYSTAFDLHQWILALKNGQLISEFSRTAMLAPHVQATSTHGYGYGWEVLQMSDGSKVVGHLGANSQLQHNSDLKWHVDKDLVFVMLSNSSEDVAMAAFSKIEDIFFNFWNQ